MESFVPGDDLIFQLESGFGLLRVIAVDYAKGSPVWHLMAYEELFPDVESAKNALAEPASLHVRRAHMAITGRAFERTPAARLGNHPLSDDEITAYHNWIEHDGSVSDRSALLRLGPRGERFKVISSTKSAGRKSRLLFLIALFVWSAP